MVFIYGVCEGNAAVAVEEYSQRYPYRRILNARTIISTFRTLRETESLPSVKIQSDRPRQHDVNVEENIIAAVERSPGISTRRISKRFGVSQSNVWRTLNNNNLYPYYKQKIQHLQPGDNDHRLEYCNWLVNHRQLIKYILFTDESQFTRDGNNNLRNQHSWAEVNPRAIIERNLQIYLCLITSTDEYILPIRPKVGVNPEEEPDFMAHHSNEGSMSSLNSDELDYNNVPANSLEPITIIDVKKKWQRNYKCTFCHKAYYKKDHLEHHLHVHTGIKPFACDLCDKSYPRKISLQRHRALHLSATPHICSVCEKGFRYKGKLDKHRKENHPEDCFRCEECDLLFSEEKDLNMHKGAHRKNNKYICKVCSKEYFSASGYYRHLRFHKKIPKRHQCDKCSESFLCRKTMMEHRERIHMSAPKTYPRVKRTLNPYKPFSCEICHKKLRSQGSLDYHRKTHFKKKPHFCKVCQITLPSRDDFVQHKRDIHPKERVFTCETCSMSFWHRELLVRHMAKHVAPPD